MGHQCKVWLWLTSAQELKRLTDEIRQNQIAFPELVMPCDEPDLRRRHSTSIAAVPVWQSSLIHEPMYEGRCECGRIICVQPRILAEITETA